MYSCPEMVLHPAIKDKKLDVVYLDTTYLNPQVSLHHAICNHALLTFRSR
jgi:DNA cross-link repair 1A protein